MVSDLNVYTGKCGSISFANLSCMSHFITWHQQLDEGPWRGSPCRIALRTQWRMSPNKSSRWSKAHQESICCWERKMKFHWKLFLDKLYLPHTLKNSCSWSPLVFKQQINWHPCDHSKTVWCWSTSLQAVCCKFKLLVMCNLSYLKFSFDWPVFYLFPL